MRRSRTERAKRVSTAAAIALLALAAARCWDTGSPFRTSSATTDSTGMPHLRPLGGVRHASRYCDPIPACTPCHGDSLQGGPDGEPSCTSCHGRHWEEPNCGMTSHTVNLGGHLHAPNYCQPLVYCARCHGADLRGGSNGEPSCTSCHDEKWRDECGN